MEGHKIFVVEEEGKMIGFLYGFVYGIPDLWREPAAILDAFLSPLHEPLLYSPYKPSYLMTAAFIHIFSQLIIDIFLKNFSRQTAA